MTLFSIWKISTQEESQGSCNNITFISRLIQQVNLKKKNQYPDKRLKILNVCTHTFKTSALWSDQHSWHHNNYSKSIRGDSMGTKCPWNVSFKILAKKTTMWGYIAIQGAKICDRKGIGRRLFLCYNSWLLSKVLCNVLNFICNCSDLFHLSKSCDLNSFDMESLSKVRFGGLLCVCNFYMYSELVHIFVCP